MRLKYFRSASKAPVLTTMKLFEVVCSTLQWLRITHVTISRPHALTSQSYVAVTQLHTNYSSYYLPGGMEAGVKLVCSWGRTRTSCTHERTWVGAANAFTI